ncbi:nuclear transport factor 2 family protein [Candidatus Poriferisodalis sp.]|uniref:nuclear transport factor 2 family protein n=1 Tax=Candidatus Poriferisodalis sp. TaxID=3101277 RepID=UPI003B0104BD
MSEHPITGADSASSDDRAGDTDSADRADGADAEIAACIEGYFSACTSGDADAVARHFTDDAVVYDTNHAPVRGAEVIGRFWSRIAAKWQGASWHCERLVTDGETAAIEWIMSGTMAAHRSTEAAEPFAVRGSEHYDFGIDGATGARLISEIRQYWTFDLDHPSSELVDYPYGDLGRLGA